jgi:hypothetical protein
LRNQRLHKRPPRTQTPHRGPATNCTRNSNVVGFYMFEALVLCL